MIKQGRLRVAIVMVLGSLAPLVLIGQVGVAQASFTWTSPETLSFSTVLGIKDIIAAPDGSALLLGFPNNNEEQLAVRPLGGPLGAPAALPGGLGYGEGVFGAMDASGDALLGSSTAYREAYRPAGVSSSVDSPEEFGTSYVPLTISLAPTGESITLVSHSGGLGAVFRGAGPAAQTELTKVQDFGPYDRFGTVGVILDPSGSAVVVWQVQNEATGETTTYQSLRPVGSPSFGKPAVIESGDGFPDLFELRLASDPSGNAVLSWAGVTDCETGCNPPQFNEIVASTRAPGGEFGKPVVLATTTPGWTRRETTPAMTADGNAIVGWNETTGVTPYKCGGSEDGAEIGAFAATESAGKWSPPSALGPSEVGKSSSVVTGAGGGETAALAVDTKVAASETECTGSVSLDRYQNTPSSGLKLEEEHQLGGGAVERMAASACGEILTTYITPKVEGALLAGFDPSICGHSSVPPGEEKQVEKEQPPGGTSPSPAPGGTGATSTGTHGGTAPPGPKSPTGILAIVPSALATLPALTSKEPTSIITCPAGSYAACVYQMILSMQPKSGSASSASRRRARKAVVVGRITATLKPGARRTVRFKLNSAGKQLVRARKLLREQLMVTVRAGTAERTFTESKTLRG